MLTLFQERGSRLAIPYSSPAHLLNHKDAHMRKPSIITLVTEREEYLHADLRRLSIVML